MTWVTICVCTAHGEETLNWIRSLESTVLESWIFTAEPLGGGRFGRWQLCTWTLCCIIRTVGTFQHRLRVWLNFSHARDAPAAGRTKFQAKFHTPKTSEKHPKEKHLNGAERSRVVNRVIEHKILLFYFSSVSGSFLHCKAFHTSDAHGGNQMVLHAEPSSCAVVIFIFYFFVFFTFNSWIFRFFSRLFASRDSWKIHFSCPFFFPSSFFFLLLPVHPFFFSSSSEASSLPPAIRQLSVRSVCPLNLPIEPFNYRSF